MATVFISCDDFNSWLRSQGYTEDEIAALGYQGAPTSSVTVRPPAAGGARTRRASGRKAKAKTSGGKKKSSAKKTSAKKAGGKKKSAKKR